MSQSTRRALVYALALFACSGVVVACATGGAANSGGGDDNNEIVDASVNGKQDASTSHITDAVVHLDAHLPLPDAFVPPATPDANTSGALCTANNQCTTTGECCVTLGGTMGFCAPGSVVLGQCFPQ